MVFFGLAQNFYLAATVIFVLVCLLTVLIKKRFLKNAAKNHFLHLNQPDYVLVVFFTVVTVFGFPLFVFLYAFFGIFRKLLGEFLKLKHGDKFGGFLENTDTFWDCEVVSKNNILMGFIVDFDGNSGDFYESVKKHLVERCFNGKIPRLTATRHRFLGYLYHLLDDFDIDDCLSIYECEENPNEGELQRILGRFANTPLPKDHTALWQVIVFNKPLISDGHLQKNRHFVMMKAHHSLADGNAIYKFVFRCLGDNDDYDEPDYDSKRKRPFFEKMLRYFTIFLLTPITCLMLLLRKEDFRCELNGNKTTIWFLDDGGKHFDKVKKVKRKLQKITFSEIVMAAISDSYNKNISKDTKLKYVSYVMTVAPYLAKFPKLKKEDPLIINNDSMSVVYLRTPGFLEDESIVGRLEEIHKGFDLVRNSYDGEVIFWVMRLVSKFLPVLTSKIVLDANTAPVVVSNVPGLPPARLFGGKALEIIGYAPNHAKCGLTVTINSNDNRFQFAIMADQGMIADEEDLRRFGFGIFESLDRLYDELSLN